MIDKIFLLNPKDKNFEKNLLSDLGESQFKFILKSPFTWIENGNHLLHGAEILFKKISKSKIKLDKIIIPKIELNYDLNEKENLIIKDWLLQSQSGFLFALSIENYLKGLWILKNRNNIKIFSRLPEEIKTHNLINLCKKTNIKLEKDEEKKLKAFSECIKWFGRYPIPIDIDANITFWNERLNLGFLFEEKNGKIKFPKFILIIINKIFKEIKLYPKDEYYNK